MANKELEKPKSPYDGKYIVISKDHKYFSINNSVLHIDKGQVHKHPGIELEPGAFEVFNSEKEAFAYIEKYKHQLVPERRGKPVIGEKPGVTSSKTFTPDKIPERPSHEEMRKGAKQLDADGKITSMDNQEADSILDQNSATVLKNLRKGKYTKDELAIIRYREEKDRKREKVVDGITKLMRKVK